MTKDKREPFVGTEVGKPIPGAQTCDGDDDTLSIRSKGFEAGMRVGLHMAMHENLWLPPASARASFPLPAAGERQRSATVST
jgi:hypothetical protein